MSRIFKRGNIWYIDYEYKGRRSRHSLNTKNKKVADLALKNIDVQIAKEELNLAKPRKATFDSFSNKFLKWYEVQNSYRSFKDYENLFGSTIMPHFKEFHLDDIDVEMIEEYKIERSKKIKPATVNKELTALKHVFNKAIEWSYLKCNPLDSVKRLKLPEKKFRFLSIYEIDLVLLKSPDHVRALLMTAIHTGMRRSELFRLEWNDIDFDRKYITVTAKNGEHTKNYRNRDIPITETLYNTLFNYQRYGQWVFSKKNGDRYVEGIRRTLDSIIREAGIPRFTLHDLRHTFASHLVMDGADLPTVQKIMGHANISTTMIYAHLAPDHLRGAMDGLNRRFVNGTNMAQSTEIYN
jgi:integrase